MGTVNILYPGILLREIDKDGTGEVKNIEVAREMETLSRNHDAESSIPSSAVFFLPLSFSPPLSVALYFPLPHVTALII